MAKEIDPIRFPFGHLLRESRKKSGKSISQVCGEVGISKPYLMDLESGRQVTHRLPMLITLANVVHVDSALLILASIQQTGRFTLKLSEEDIKNPRKLRILVRIMEKWDDLTEDQLQDLINILKRGE